jgi:hypothetical protein
MPTGCSLQVMIHTLLAVSQLAFDGVLVPDQVCNVWSNSRAANASLSQAMVEEEDEIKGRQGGSSVSLTNNISQLLLPFPEEYVVDSDEGGGVLL